MEPGQLPPLLALDKVACLRGGRMLFAGLDLRLHPGDAILLSGPNGVGKSSLLRLCAGLLKPYSGRVQRAAMALADESLALDSEQSLRQALAFWARIDGQPAQAIDQALALFALDPLSSVPVRMLSTGQRKRAVLARSFASGACVLLLDEPANGLDAENVKRLEQAIAAHRARGGAVLIASHLPIGVAGATSLVMAPMAETVLAEAML